MLLPWDRRAAGRRVREVLHRRQRRVMSSLRRVISRRGTGTGLVVAAARAAVGRRRYPLRRMGMRRSRGAAVGLDVLELGARVVRRRFLVVAVIVVFPLARTLGRGAGGAVFALAGSRVGRGLRC